MSHSETVTHRFGPFEYDPQQRLLFRDGEVVPLVPKAIDTLHVLLEWRGRVVEKNELMKLVWPDTTVEEVGLARNISLLRKALGDEAGALIETIPKRGYRFAAPDATVSSAAATPRRWRRLAWTLGAFAALVLLVYWQFYRPSRYLPTGKSFASLAAIPFTCVPSTAECEAVSAGFNELLTAELTKVKGLHVISPSTIRRYRGLGVSEALMARILGVEVTLEGTIQGEQASRKLTVRLADVHSGKLIWAENLEGVTPRDAATAISAAVGAVLQRKG